MYVYVWWCIQCMYILYIIYNMYFVVYMYMCMLYVCSVPQYHLVPYPSPWYRILQRRIHAAGGDKGGKRKDVPAVNRSVYVHGTYSLDVVTVCVLLQLPLLCYAVLYSTFILCIHTYHNIYTHMYMYMCDVHNIVSYIHNVVSYIHTYTIACVVSYIHNITSYMYTYY